MIQDNKVPDRVIPLFTAEQRAQLRSELLELAARDSRITGAAITGSAADAREDRWSDVDLAFGISFAEDLSIVLSDWTAHMYAHHGALHHLDVPAGTWTYRVFILPNTLQVDLAFVPETDFRALAPTFQLISGKANEPQYALPPPAESIVGMGWLYALHARSCIARQKLWQAEYMISGVRDCALALACIRHGLPAAHGRGVDLLPSHVTTQFEDSLVRHLSTVELSRAFRAVMEGLLDQIRSADENLAKRLQGALHQLIDSWPLF